MLFQLTQAELIVIRSKRVFVVGDGVTGGLNKKHTQDINNNNNKKRAFVTLRLQAVENIRGSCGAKH